MISAGLFFILFSHSFSFSGNLGLKHYIHLTIFFYDHLLYEAKIM
uniref:Uncharacterized protein n=1 Tax=Setaria viridis TaxID=4556 RepID=A0A4U6VE16_SETVI|nr:hypothetical protein SEVIR_3G216750v2 [Setaria viridis]